MSTTPSSNSLPAPEWDCQCRSVYVTTVDDDSIAHDFLPDGTVEYRNIYSDLLHNWIAPAPMRRVTITVFDLVGGDDETGVAEHFGPGPENYWPTDQLDIAAALAELGIDGDAADHRWQPVTFERVDGEWVRQS